MLCSFVGGINALPACVIEGVVISMGISVGESINISGLNESATDSQDSNTGVEGRGENTGGQTSFINADKLDDGPNKKTIKAGVKEADEISKTDNQIEAVEDEGEGEGKGGVGDGNGDRHGDGDGDDGNSDGDGKSNVKNEDDGDGGDSQRKQQSITTGADTADANSTICTSTATTTNGNRIKFISAHSRARMLSARHESEARVNDIGMGLNVDKNYLDSGVQY
jgi:hypothetical protein